MGILNEVKFSKDAVTLHEGDAVVMISDGAVVGDEKWLEELSIKEGLQRLNDREKKILRLRFFEGRTQMEVAGEIGISQAQVSRLEKNALIHMRKYVSAQ